MVRTAGGRPAVDRNRLTMMMDCRCLSLIDSSLGPKSLICITVTITRDELNHS